MKIKQPKNITKHGTAWLHTKHNVISQQGLSYNLEQQKRTLYALVSNFRSQH